MDNHEFSKYEYRFLFGLGSVLGLRQLALTIVMPFIAIYGRNLKGSTPLLIGLAVGIYGLVQALLQIPYGIWSDKIGRKPMVLLGLLQFSLGLILAGFATNVYTLILGRAIQGSGAVQSVATAWISDDINIQKRNRAIGLTGVIIAFSAVFSFIAGPIFQQYISISNMFIICGFLSLLAFVYILAFLKEGKKNSEAASNQGLIMSFMKNKLLVKISIGGFLINYIVTGVFIIVPFLLEGYLGDKDLWKVFIPAIVLGIIPLKKLIKLTDNGHLFVITLSSFTVIAIGAFCFFSHFVMMITVGMILFMAGYLYLSTMLPSSITKISPKQHIGIYSGLFNTFQFIGSFVGGLVTGLLWENSKMASILILILLCLVGGAMFIIGGTNSMRKAKELSVVE